MPKFNEVQYQTPVDSGSEVGASLDLAFGPSMLFQYEQTDQQDQTPATLADIEDQLKRGTQTKRRKGSR